MCVDSGRHLMLKSLLKYFDCSVEQIYNNISDAVWKGNFDTFKVLMEHIIEKFNKDIVKLFVKRLFPKIWHKIKYVSDQTMVFFTYINALDKDIYENYKKEHKEEIDPEEQYYNKELNEKFRKIDRYLKEENQI
jgi:hypothetical protein